LLPREKLQKRGLNALTDTDLVTVLLGFGTKKMDVVSLAGKVANLLSKQISSQIGEDLNCKDWIRGFDIEKLTNLSGIGKVKAMKLVCALELGRRIFADSLEDKKIIKSSKDVIEEMAYLKKLKQEHVVVLLLDSRNILLNKMTVAVGTLNKVVVEPRDVFYKAIEHQSAKIILVHNHPSGDLAPSKADVKFAAKMKKAGEILGITVLDQIIV
jgi:DNA repair protein RadC